MTGSSKWKRQGSWPKILQAPMMKPSKWSGDFIKINLKISFICFQKMFIHNTFLQSFSTIHSHWNTSVLTCIHAKAYSQTYAHKLEYAHDKHTHIHTHTHTCTYTINMRTSSHQMLISASSNVKIICLGEPWSDCPVLVLGGPSRMSDRSWHYTRLRQVLCNLAWVAHVFFRGSV